MRLATFFGITLALSAISLAQETNFPAGPQYLMISGSPLFARPIATPSLSLGEAPLPSSPAITGEAAEAQPQPTPPQAQFQGDLTRIYWGEPQAREPEIIEISSEEPRSLPESFVESGVIRMTSVESLRERGYGIPLGETAAYWKAHKTPASRVYTNRDIERLHGS